ncbi:hypothetical protein AJ80_03508 [Polytolypa hystricis UAMH7299]|uniref:Uncharacterized protein n=1 Tax=Polytolypa hystricis (strain UAMH7299) TaxID=1447883 RepID=A0A2B7YIR2_POLH7|nr:hypothetical protein AJ80_03508 [Polytolypa hystricis UAMH7299]
MQELWYWLEEREAYRKEYTKVWNDTATSVNSETGIAEDMVNVILSPAGPGVAPAHNTAKYWGYTSQWNLLDYPALVFPMIQRRLQGFQFHSSLLAGDLKMRRSLRYWNIKQMIDLPFGIV